MDNNPAWATIKLPEIMSGLTLTDFRKMQKQKMT